MPAQRKSVILYGNIGAANLLRTSRWYRSWYGQIWAISTPVVWPAQIAGFSRPYAGQRHMSQLEIDYYTDRIKKEILSPDRLIGITRFITWLCETSVESRHLVVDTMKNQNACIDVKTPNFDLSLSLRQGVGFQRMFPIFK
ncbi:hypothetical protein DM860_012808 [Cuscuta australis]|uniref:Uncharacterized protein n=1 Tax=Cuscuta australis TaxID=267555 RepID=A0A328DUG0_9ASTE|nr:hypothetical protein DM860_012808 [Cuscuta australis]